MIFHLIIYDKKYKLLHITKNIPKQLNSASAVTYSLKNYLCAVNIYPNSLLMTLSWVIINLLGMAIIILFAGISH